MGVEGEPKETTTNTNGIIRKAYLAQVTLCFGWCKGQPWETPQTPFFLNEDDEPAKDLTPNPEEGPKAYDTKGDANEAIRRYRNALMQAIEQACGC